jgi:hypothetical protein
MQCREKPCPPPSPPTPKRRFEPKAGDRLAARDRARARELDVVQHCPFTSAFIATNAEFTDPVA